MTAALWLIEFYQREISPRKGFSCAHRALHQHDSCSQFGKRVISRLGLTRGLLLLERRLLACRRAAEIIAFNSAVPPPLPDTPPGPVKSCLREWNGCGISGCVGDMLGQAAVEMACTSLGSCF